MKNWIITAFLFFSSFGFAQVSTTRINDIKMGMSLTDLEKMVGNKIKLKVDEDGYPLEEINVTYKGIKYKLYFWHFEEGNKVSSIEASDSSLKTLSGIGIGSSLEDLWSKYKAYNISIFNGWDENGNKSNERYFSIQDNDNGTQLRITLKNNKVVSFSVYYYEGC